MRKHIMETINTKTMSVSQVKKDEKTVKTWADVQEKYPRLADPAYMEGWLPAYKGRPRKQPPPQPFVNAIIEALNKSVKPVLAHAPPTKCLYSYYK